MASPRTKKKILVLTSTFPRWKNDTNPPFVYDLSCGLADSFNIIILTPHYPGTKDTETMDKLRVYRFHYFFERFEQLAGNEGILPTLKANKLHYLSVPFFLLFEIIATLRLVKKYKPDIIHAHWIIPQGIAAYINWLVNKTPYVITSHGSDLHSLKLTSLKKIILNHAKKITVVSNDLKQKVLKINPNLISKIEVIPMGVDTKLFNPNKYDKSIKTKYGIAGKFLLFVGRLIPEKGITCLIDVMPAVLHKFPKTKLMIIGGGTLEKKLKNKVSKLKIESNVIFLGVIKHDDLPPYFATADIFISLSIKEGFGLTIVEALMSGCTAISTNTGGINDILSKKYLIEGQNSSAIVNKIAQIFNSHTPSNIVNSMFSYSTIIKAYTKKFKLIMDYQVSINKMNAGQNPF